MLLLAGRLGLLRRSLGFRGGFGRSSLLRRGLLRWGLLRWGAFGRRSFFLGRSGLQRLLAARIISLGSRFSRSWRALGRGGSLLRALRRRLAAALAQLFRDGLAEIGRALHGAHASALESRELVSRGALAAR